MFKRDSVRNRGLTAANETEGMRENGARRKEVIEETKASKEE